MHQMLLSRDFTEDLSRGFEGGSCPRKAPEAPSQFWSQISVLPFPYQNTDFAIWDLPEGEPSFLCGSATSQSNPVPDLQCFNYKTMRFYLKAVKEVFWVSYLSCWLTNLRLIFFFSMNQ